MASRRAFLAQAFAAPLLSAAVRPPNILLITADDMNWDSPNCFGGTVPNLTPNIDRLASQGMRFERAHVTVSVCQPSRSVWMTGRYPHRNGAEGFQPIRTDVPTLQERLRAAGFRNGILAKTTHLAPREKFCWDFHIEAGELLHGRGPSLYYKFSKEFFRQARSAGKPFFLMANSQDPHSPFAGSENELKNFGVRIPYDRKIDPGEVAAPGFLPDLAGVRKELSHYFSSVHRCDQTVGQVLRALAESGLEDNTLVMFLSDNGMAFPFSKTNCYLNSTRTPWVVRWPGKVKTDSINRDDFISGIDLTPTVLEAAGLPALPGVDGRSFLSLLQGRRQTGRDRVFTVFHETSGKLRYEMRCVQDRRFGYIFNPWSDGKTVFRNGSQGAPTFQAMQEAAKTDPAMAERMRLLLYRTPEEFYDFAADPNALDNLAGREDQRREMDRLRAVLRENMARTGDPLLGVFDRMRS